MAAIASQSAALRASAPAPARAGARRAGKAVRLPSSRAPGSVVPRRRGDAAVTSAAAELAQVALDEETITIIIAAVIGLGAGLGVPIFFVMQVRTTRLIPYRAFPRSARRDRPRASRPRPRDRRARAALTRFPRSTCFSRRAGGARQGAPRGDPRAQPRDPEGDRRADERGGNLRSQAQPLPRPPRVQGRRLIARNTRRRRRGTRTRTRVICGSIDASVTKSRVRRSHAFAVAATRLGYNA